MSEAVRAVHAEPRAGRIKLVSVNGIFAHGHNKATLRVEFDGVSRVIDHEGGTGPVDAICNALREIRPFQVVQCRTGSLGRGSDAYAEARVTIEDVAGGDAIYSGTARSTNTLDATAMAFVDAINGLLSDES